MNIQTVIKIILAALATVSLGACINPTIASAKKEAAYQGTTARLVVVIEGSHLQKAFASVAQGSTERQRESTEARLYFFRMAIHELSTALKSRLAKEGVDTVVDLVDISLDRTPVFSALARYRNPQILLLRTESFETSTVTNRNTNFTREQGWTGKVSWSVDYYDLLAGNAAGGTATATPKWKAKTDLFHFDPTMCHPDMYKNCSERVASAIVAQMKADGLFGPRKP